VVHPLTNQGEEMTRLLIAISCTLMGTHAFAEYAQFDIITSGPKTLYTGTLAKYETKVLSGKNHLLLSSSFVRDRKTCLVSSSVANTRGFTIGELFIALRLGARLTCYVSAKRPNLATSIKLDSSAHQGFPSR